MVVRCQAWVKVPFLPFFVTLGISLYLSGSMTWHCVCVCVSYLMKIRSTISAFKSCQLPLLLQGRDRGSVDSACTRTDLCLPRWKAIQPFQTDCLCKADVRKPGSQCDLDVATLLLSEEMLSEECSSGVSTSLHSLVAHVLGIQCV